MVGGRIYPKQVLTPNLAKRITNSLGYPKNIEGASVNNFVGKMGREDKTENVFALVLVGNMISMLGVCAFDRKDPPLSWRDLLPPVLVLFSLTMFTN